MEQPFDLESIHGMTADKLRSYPGLENLSDEEAERRIFSLYQLMCAFFDYYPVENSNCIDNQHFVSLEEQKQAA